MNLQVNTWWSQLKTAGSAIYANRHYLELYRFKNPERLCQENIGDGKRICKIIPDVRIHPTATIHPSAVVNKNNNYHLKHLLYFYFLLS